MSDILERAESLLEISNCSARAEEFRKSAADLLPDLVAECKRLEEVLAGTTRGIEDARYECRRAMAEAARWQAVAVEEKAWSKFNQDCRDDVSFKDVSKEYMQQAAAALGKPRAWGFDLGLTIEQRAALETGIDLLRENEFYFEDIYKDLCRSVSIILRESGPAWEEAKQ